MRNLIIKAAQNAINSSLGDIPVNVVLRSIVTGVYNPTTGSASRTTTDTTVKGVLVGVNQKDTNDLELLTSGKKVLIAGADLAGIEVDALDDMIVIDDVVWHLKSYKVDPAGALYQLMIVKRSPK